MARIRTIKPEFWTSAQVMECSPIARLMFIGMWNFADDAGRLSYSEKTIKAQVFPSDDMPSENIRGLLVELASNGLLLIYEFSGQKYIQITGWKHQRIDKARPSAIPAPIDAASTNSRGSLATDLTLSYPKGSYLNGDGSLASRGDALREPKKKDAPQGSPELVASLKRMGA